MFELIISLILLLIIIGIITILIVISKIHGKVNVLESRLINISNDIKDTIIQLLFSNRDMIVFIKNNSINNKEILNILFQKHVRLETELLQMRELIEALQSNKKSKTISNSSKTKKVEQKPKE